MKGQNYKTGENYLKDFLSYTPSGGILVSAFYGEVVSCASFPTLHNFSGKNFQETYCKQYLPILTSWEHIFIKDISSIDNNKYIRPF